MFWIWNKCLNCICKEKVPQPCIFYCKFLILNGAAKLLLRQSAHLDELYLVTGANIASTLNSNQFNWLSPYWLGRLFECGRGATKSFNCFNHRQGTEAGMVVLESNVLTSQDHMERKKALQMFVSHAVQPPPAGAAGFKTPQRHHSTCICTCYSKMSTWMKKWSGNLQLQGKDLEQPWEVEALIKTTGHGFAFQSSEKMNVWLREPV